METTKLFTLFVLFGFFITAPTPDKIVLPVKEVQFDWTVSIEKPSLINESLVLWRDRIQPDNTQPPKQELFHSSMPEMMNGRSGQIIRPVSR
ncbi:MAG: hypothetical protein LAT76_06420 [Schleiferiaceae bacterium]|nr:hypothetical protein [Schleiferiaceae bacterium]